MFSYPFGAIGDPNNTLLSSVCCPFDESVYAASPFLVDEAFPASSSLPSPSDCFMRRSSTEIPDRAAQVLSYSPSARDFHWPEPVRRVYSTGDLQGMNNMQVSAENCAQEGAAAAAAALIGRVGRYTAEERKERIERYRSKRSQRNFHKKITYNCRKTLADSRPRVRGRFARNGETETETETETEPESSETAFRFYGHDACADGRGCNGLDGSGDRGDWLEQMQAALVATDGEEARYEDDIWAGLDSVLAVNLLS